MTAAMSWASNRREGLARIQAFDLDELVLCCSNKAAARCNMRPRSAREPAPDF